MTENRHERRTEAAEAEGRAEANQDHHPRDGQAPASDSLPGEPGVDRPPTADEIRAAEEAAVDAIYELRVYSECGGPEPREHGCGSMIWLNGGQAIEAALRGRAMIVKCKKCGTFNRLVPPPQPQQQMVQPAGASMQRRIMDAMAKGNGSSRLLGPNGKPWGS